MRSLILVTSVLAVMCVATSQAVVIYSNDYEGETLGNGSPGWNWGTDVCSHSAVFADDGTGNVVIQHTGTVDNATGAAADARFGSKWDITVSGNTSSDPADYTISFDVRNVSGDWNPIVEGLAVLTKENPDAGHGFQAQEFLQADGWVHVEFNLADWVNNWWEASEWDLTNPNWSLEIGQPWPGISVPDGTSFTQVWLFDNLRIVMGGDTAPYDPIPVDGETLAGTPVNLTEADVTLEWKAGVDPNSVTDYPVNPDILRHNVYLTPMYPGDGNDLSNEALIDSIIQVHNADPYLTDPNNSYGPVTLVRGVTYYWQIEQVLDNGADGYGAGDPNNILGPLWSFDVVPAVASLNPVNPAYTAIDAGSDLVLTVTGTAIETYQWYKIGDPDVALVDGADYSGTTTDTLNILDVQQADEGEYYCVGINSLPSEASNRETGPATVWTKRLVSHYPMESMDYGADANGVTVDVVSGVYDMRMASNDVGNDVPVLDGNSKIGVSSLMLDNPAAAGSNPPAADGDPNYIFAQYAEIENEDLVAYEDITISAWVYSNGGTAWNRIVDLGNNNQNYIDIATNWWGNAGRLGCEIHVGGSGDAAVSPEGAVPNNEWIFVTATLSGDSLRLYIDGELVGGPTNVTQNPISFGPTTQNWIGRSQWGAGDGYYDGLIDDLKIYNYGLSATEVGQKYLTDESIVDWVCDWESYNQDTTMMAFDVDDNCEINLDDFAAFAARWMDDIHHISLP